MALFRSFKNTLFGNDGEPNKLGRFQTDSEFGTAQMINAKLMDSKLLTSNNDLFDPLEEDPLKFKHFTYPNDLSTLVNGHYVKFDIYQNRVGALTEKPDFNADFSNTNQAHKKVTISSEFKNVLKNTFRVGPSKSPNSNGKNVASDSEEQFSTSVFEKEFQRQKNPQEELKVNNAEAINMDLHNHTHEHASIASILLYTTSTNKFQTAMNYENAETGFLAEAISDDSIASVLGSVGTKVIGKAAVAALEVVVPGAGGFFNRSTGMAVNPNMELAFKSVPFRSFNFGYTFAPKNKKELNQVHKIIQLFRYHMSPSLVGTAQFFAAPSQFVLTYMYREDKNNYIPKIAKCVLETLDVDYSPGEKFTTLKQDGVGASPQLIKMDMQFKEMSIITKDSIAKGF